LSKFHDKFAVQLNDTHPAIAVPELMRLLIDEYGMEWEPAWEITRKTFAYTNHTLMPKALEKWAVPLFSRVLPRIMEIVYEINRRFLNEVRARYPGDEERVSRMSLIAEQDEKYVRMANLACVGSYSVNGVSKLHSELLRTRVLRDFHEFWPGKFSNKTNGVTPRRFMALCNPRLTALICDAIGDKWISRLEELERLTPFADDPAFLKEWRKVKRANKQDLAAVIRERTGVAVSPDSLFDVQAKRIHEYKRQHLNLLHIITLYNRLKRNPAMETPARTFIFSGKAAPGYYAAKLIIKLVCSVADAINNDASVRDRLKVVFFPDFNVKNAQRIYPAADLSEQISTAGLEASGTGNMKFALNGALTIGTLDGANIEIRDAVGPENFFLFGLTTDEVERKKSGGYNPAECCRANLELKEAIEMISSGVFSPHERDLFKPLIGTLFEIDKYMLFADYPAYVKCQETVGAAYMNAGRWARMSVLNVARMGYFSSDRAIAEYCADIWKVKPVHIKLVD
jgi:starch phosphorylase